MKVTGPGQTQGPSKTKKKDNAQKSDGSFEDFIASAPQEKAQTTNTQSIAMVDSLLAIQGAEDPTARAAKQRARKRADMLLDELEGLREAMLRGDLTVGHMIDVADVVAQHREKISDPSLTAIMDEIDLRAQVELAKMRVALDKQEARNSQKTAS